MNPKTLVGWTLVWTTLLAGCGGSPSEKTHPEDTLPIAVDPPEWPADESAPATPTPEPTPAPPAFADGIYVSRFGIDTNPGTGEQHLRTIRAAIERAKALGKKDIWLASDEDGWTFEEIVRIPDGIDIHGGVCIETYPMAPPAVMNAAACRTVIGGASPALLAEGITQPTLVENLEVRGRGIEGNDYAFKVPGGACLGRASETAAASVNVTQACTPSATDARSSFAAWASSSSQLTFSNVTLVAADAEPGRNGTDGTPGDPGSDGVGIFAGANSTCPESSGGAGGLGGRWGYRKLLRGFEGQLLPSQPGAPSALAPDTAGAPGLDDLRRTTGTAGSAALALDPFDADAAPSGIAALSESFVAGSGALGLDGVNGAGGSGGGGGAVGVTFVFRYCTPSDTSAACAGTATDNTWVPVGEGALSYDESIVAPMAQTGETDGGNGGAGGAGGCGGTKGMAGTGGGSSIAMVVRSSQISLKSSTLVAGRGGNGGKGGVGGAGGMGGAGAAGEAGEVSEQVNINGLVSVKNGKPVVQVVGPPRRDPSQTEGISFSAGGAGGEGARGQDGEPGWTGGSGAGGATVGLYRIRSNVETADVTITLGDRASGGRSDDGLAVGEDGLRAPEVAQE